MAKNPNPLAKYPSLDYINDYIDLAQTLIFEESVQLGQTVDRIQTEDYSFSDWTKDVWKTWLRAENNTRRLICFPVTRQAERSGAMPHLVFLVDSKAQDADVQELDLAEPLPAAMNILMTELVDRKTGNKIPNGKVTLVIVDGRTLQVGLQNLNPLVTDTKGVPRPPAGEYSAVIYISGRSPREPLATVTVYMNIDANEGQAKKAVPQDTPTTDPTDPAERTAAALDKIGTLLQTMLDGRKNTSGSS